mmetsp:Transcript_17388/g.16591  ORF Transcript_17388/g.16591 Transcript_17388/m.16591 type:complete len:82 (+) Transcript_17388:1042-1287(+)
MVLTTGKPTTAAIFAYFKPQEIFPGGLGSPRSAFHKWGFEADLDDLQRVSSGFHVKSYLEVVKYEVQIQVDEIDLYVATIS